MATLEAGRWLASHDQPSPDGQMASHIMTDHHWSDGRTASHIMTDCHRSVSQTDRQTGRQVVGQLDISDPGDANS